MFILQNSKLAWVRTDHWKEKAAGTEVKWQLVMLGQKASQNLLDFLAIKDKKGWFKHKEEGAEQLITL